MAPFIIPLIRKLFKITFDISLALMINSEQNNAFQVITKINERVISVQTLVDVKFQNLVGSTPQLNTEAARVVETT